MSDFKAPSYLIDVPPPTISGETFCPVRIEESKKYPINFTLGVIYDQICDYFTVFLGDFR